MRRLTRTATLPTDSSSPRFDAGSPRAPGRDLRCGCHRLLARAVAEGIELRCPRCKADTLLRWELVRDLEASLAKR